MEMAVVQTHHTGDHTDGEIKVVHVSPLTMLSILFRIQVSHLHADDITKVKAKG